LGERDPVDGGVELPVPAAGEPVAVGVPEEAGIGAVPV
jgi:hypothetical protein